MTLTRITKKRRLAHHEAGHAVLSAAINDAPYLVGIRANDSSLGRSRCRFEAQPERLVQVHLAGFAAEELLSGRPPRQLRGPELGFSVVAATEPSLAAVASVLEGSDQYLAIQEILKIGCDRSSKSIREEFERFYAVAKASLGVVWPAVAAVAEDLMKLSELGSDAFFSALRGHDIYGPVFAVQEAHGLRSHG